MMLTQFNPVHILVIYLHTTQFKAMVAASFQTRSPPKFHVQLSFPHPSYMPNQLRCLDFISSGITPVACGLSYKH